MKITTWNINSVRLRLPIVLKYLTEQQPDILCLQETKCPDEFFPHAAFHEIGYAHQHIWGMKSYNGLAIISKIPLKDAAVFNRVSQADCRHMSVTLPDGIILHNVYIPAGGDTPDPAVNPKFKHKLDFVDELKHWWPHHHGEKKRAPMIIVGDLNIAPLEHDVYNHKQMLKIVSHTPVEVEKFTAMQNAVEWYDAMRHFVPQDQKLYSWWSYRAADWRMSDRGRRLDHIWVTPDLQPQLRALSILKDARGWTQPSDHVPVLVELDI